MRKWHRWISTAAMLLLAWVATTGVLLALDTMFPPAGLGGAAPATTTQAAPPSPTTAETTPASITQLVQWANTALTNAVTTASTASSFEMEVTAQQPAARVTVTRNDATLTIDAESGAVLSTMATTTAPASAEPKTAWYNDLNTRLALHDLLQDLHRGTIIGISGQVLDILTGLSFAFLSISGAVMYLQLYARRRKSGNSHLFWK